MFPLLLKISYIPGLTEVVLSEISRYIDVSDLQKSRKMGHEGAYIICTPEVLSAIPYFLKLRSISQIFLVYRDAKLNPRYIYNHKSVLGDLVDIVFREHVDVFRTFKFSCAGSDSKEVQSIEEYISTQYKLEKSQDADLEIYIGKDTEADGKRELWEVGVRLTTRPLSVRDYRVGNIKGGMNPTVAYAVNVCAGIGSGDTLKNKSYLNIFSGSATLLIEACVAGFSGKLIGFDTNKKTNSLAIQNIKKAGFIEKIQIKTADIFDIPDFGMFDIIASDLPFGMQVSKGEDLEKLYQVFVEYCEKVLNSDGILVVYTSEYVLLEKILSKSKFIIKKQLSLKIPTSVGAYLQTKILVCERR